MSGAFQGVQARIKEVQPLAIYNHCASHRSNLVLIDTCELTPIRNMLGTVKEVINFIHDSAKRDAIYKSQFNYKPAHTRLISLCQTRWTERGLCLKVFAQYYEAIIDTLEVICTNKLSNGKACANARSFILALQQPEFLVSLFMAKDIFVFLQLQSKQIYLLNCIDHIENVVNVLKTKRLNVDQYFQFILHNQIDDVYGLMKRQDIEFSMPRTCKKQAKRNNVPAETAEQYDRHTVFGTFNYASKHPIQPRS